MASANETPLVGIVMGSKSDWEVMRLASETLTQLGIANECRVISAHRAPDALFEYVSQAESRGLRVMIAGAGGAAHLPGSDCGKDDPAGSRRTHAIKSAPRTRFPALHRPNAQGHSRRHPGHR